MHQKIKNYQNQLAQVFKRFPIVVSFALYMAISFTALYLLDGLPYLWTRHLNFSSRISIWLSLYPIPAMILAYAMKLREETRKKNTARIHLLAQISWAAIILLYIIFPSQHCYEAILSFGFLIIASPFIVPFWKKTSDLALWKFGGENIKSAGISFLVTGALNISILFLIYAIEELFEVDIPTEAPVISSIVCWASIFPILFLAGIPKITEETDVKRSKFAMNVIHFLFIPLFLLYTAFLYAFGIKIIFLDADYDMVSIFASIATLSMLIICTILYPSHFEGNRKVDRILLVAMPLLTLPPNIFMAADTLYSLRNEITEVSLIYCMYLALWYISIVIISSCCTKKKLRFILISFCVGAILASASPLNAYSISKKLTTKNLRNILAKHGYNDLPLNCEQLRKANKEINASGFKESREFEILPYYISSTFGESTLEQYLPSYSSECILSEKEDFSPQSFNASSQATRPSAIPPKRSRAIIYNKHVLEDFFIVKDSILSFQITPIPDDTLEKHSFSVPLDTLKNRSEEDGVLYPLILEDSSSTFVVQEFELYYDENYKNLNVHGILYLE